MKEHILIFGNSGIAEIAHYYFTNDSMYDVKAFVVDDEFVGSGVFKNCPVVAYSELIKLYPVDTAKFFVAISYQKLNKIRAEVYLRLKSLGYSFASYVSSRAIILNGNRIGENSFILENNVIQPFSVIGNNNILWSGNHIGHHSVVCDNNFFASQVVVSGNCRVGSNNFLGVNATIRDGVVVGNECILGAGALITRNVVDKSIYIEKETPRAKIDTETFLRLGGQI